MDQEDIILLLILIVIALVLENPCTRRWWVRPLFLLRARAGQYHQHFRFMRENDKEMFFEYTRLTVEQFDLLLELVGPSLEKNSIREPLSPEFRLVITL